MQQITYVCVTTAYSSCTYINLRRTLNHPSLALIAGVRGVFGVMALCSEACVSSSGGESSGSEVSFSLVF